VGDPTYQPPDGFVTMAVAATQLGVSIVTLRKRITDGVLRSYADPLNRRVRLAKVDELDQLTRPVLSTHRGGAA
jgi:hypothetical protein